jgi:hypothetical protein
MTINKDTAMSNRENFSSTLGRGKFNIFQRGFKICSAIGGTAISPKSILNILPMRSVRKASFIEASVPFISKDS